MLFFYLQGESDDQLAALCSNCKADTAPDLFKAVKLGAFLISIFICITIGWLRVTSLLPPPLLCCVCILMDHLGWLSGEMTLKAIHCNNRPKETGAHTINVLQISFAGVINQFKHQLTTECFHSLGCYMRSAGSAKDNVRSPSSSNLQCDEEPGSCGCPEVTPVFKFNFPVSAPDQGTGSEKKRWFLESVECSPDHESCQLKNEVSSLKLKDL